MAEGKLVREEIDLNELVREVARRNSRRGSGAIAIFVGVVKGVVDEDPVVSLEYEAYQPYAEEKLEQIAREEEGDNIDEVRIYHRIGSLGPGEPTIYIVVAGKSRIDAISSIRRLVERVKHEVPIFKLERRSSGEYWVLGDGKRERRTSS